MTETMLTRVARAIASELERSENVPDDIAFAYLGTACAAIEAMREPTEDMIEAGRGAGLREAARQNYNLMIDAALNERQEAGE